MQRNSEKSSIVGWGYFRMYDPEGLAMISDRMQSSKGKNMRNGLYPMSAKGNLRRVKPGGNRLSMFSGALGNGEPKNTISSSAVSKLGWSDLYTAQHGNETLELGSTIEGSQAISATYHGVAAKKGKIRVGRVTGGPFTATEVKTYTGYYKNGYPEIAGKVSGKDQVLSVNVEAGMEYDVTYELIPNTVGKFDAVSELWDGEATDMHLKGEVTPGTGSMLQTSWKDNNFNFAPGHFYHKKIKIKVAGSSPVTVKAKPLDQGPLSALKIEWSQASVVAQPGQDAEIDMGIGVSGQTPDTWNLAVPIEVSAYNGEKKTVLIANVHVETLWHVVTTSQTLLNYTVSSTLSYNSTGYWQWSGLVDNHRTAAAQLLCASVINANVDGSGHKLGCSILTSAPAGGTNSFVADGFDSRLANKSDALIPAGVKSFLGGYNEHQAFLAQYNMVVMNED